MKGHYSKDCPNPPSVKRSEPKMRVGSLMRVDMSSWMNPSTRPSNDYEERNRNSLRTLNGKKNKPM